MAKWLPLSSLIIMFFISSHWAITDATGIKIAYSVVLGTLSIIEYYLVITIDND